MKFLLKNKKIIIIVNPYAGLCLVAPARKACFRKTTAEPGLRPAVCKARRQLFFLHSVFYDPIFNKFPLFKINPLVVYYPSW